MGLLSIFSGKRGDAFALREKRQKVWQRVRRMVDCSTPNTMSDDESQRSWKRYNRCLPIACVPLIGDSVQTNSIYYGATKELSDNGVSLITPQLVEEECSDLICGFWIDDLLLISSKVRRNRSFGGNLHEVGIEFFEIIDSSEVISMLKDELRSLLPNADGFDLNVK